VQREIQGKEKDMKVKILKTLGRALAITAFVMAASVASSYGQGAPGNMEVAGHLGIVSGIGSHGSFGGNLAVPVANNFLVSGDLSYIPMGGGSVTTNGLTTSAGARAFNFNGTLQYQFKQTHSFVPYAGAGLGFLHSSFDTSSNLQPGFNVTGSSTDLYFNVGGGLRYFVNERWGFKPELMIFAGPSTYVRVAAGVFYRFGE
jgi:Outer membrane protein beta-barrel domain